MKRSVFIFCLLFSIYINVNGQKAIAHNNLVWFGDFAKGKLNDKWSIYFDFGFRRTHWLNKWSQILVRPGITYNLNSNVSATVGVAYFSHYTPTYIRPEYRGWQQLLFSETFGRVKVNHRLRAEQRFIQKAAANVLIEDYSYNNRFRYQLSLQFALNRKLIESKTLYLAISDEVLINSGKEIVNNYFDQNRLAIGVGFNLNERLNILVSYMNVFVQKPKVDSFESNNVLVLNLYHNFDLKRKNNKNNN